MGRKPHEDKNIEDIKISGLVKQTGMYYGVSTIWYVSFGKKKKVMKLYSCFTEDGCNKINLFFRFDLKYVAKK